MKTVPVISESFSRVDIDLAGPITPCSDRGQKYISTIRDYATRFPEAICLKNGAIEGLNGVLKAIIKKLCPDHPQN